MSTDCTEPDFEGTRLAEILASRPAAAVERVRALAQSWATLPGEDAAADVDRRVGMVLLGMLDSGTAADVALSRVAELAGDWERPGGQGLFYPAAGQAVLDAIRGGSTEEEAGWRSRAEAAEAKLAAIAAHCRARMKAPGRSGMSLSAATLILGIAEGSDEGAGRE